MKTEEDLLPPGAQPGSVPTDLDQSTGLERLEILGKMQGIDIFDMKPLDASRFGMELLTSACADYRLRIVAITCCFLILCSCPIPSGKSKNRRLTLIRLQGPSRIRSWLNLLGMSNIVAAPAVQQIHIPQNGLRYDVGSHSFEYTAKTGYRFPAVARLNAVQNAAVCIRWNTLVQQMTRMHMSVGSPLFLPLAT